MAVFMFWNTRENNIPHHVAEACREHSVDLLILAECAMRSVDLLNALNPPTINGQTYYEAPGVSVWLKFFTRYPLPSFEAISDDGRIAVRHIKPQIGQDILVVAAHLPSKLYQEEIDQAYQASILVEQTEKAEQRIGHRNTLIIGDLNMNPFESPMMAANGLHGVMDRQIAKQIQRTVQSRDWAFFYNPMWNHLGDDADPPGTFFYRDSGMLTYFWNTFDQVLLRPELLDYYETGGVQVLRRIGTTDLLSNGRVDTTVSDHLPVVLRLNLERKVLGHV